MTPFPLVARKGYTLSLADIPPRAATLVHVNALRGTPQSLGGTPQGEAMGVADDAWQDSYMTIASGSSYMPCSC